MAEGWLQTQGLGVIQASLIEGFKRDYTMASERKVFDGVASANRLSGITPPAERPEDKLEAELFTDLSAATDALSSAAPAQTPEAATDPETAVARATAATPAMDPAAVPASDTGDLGANVELF
jgi:hypothetical protein